MTLLQMAERAEYSSYSWRVVGRIVKGRERNAPRHIDITGERVVRGGRKEGWRASEQIVEKAEELIWYMCNTNETRMTMRQTEWRNR